MSITVTRQRREVGRIYGASGAGFPSALAATSNLSRSVTDYGA